MKKCLEHTFKFMSQANVGASWNSFIQALTYDEPSMLLFEPTVALAVIHDYYDLRF